MKYVSASFLFLIGLCISQCRKDYKCTCNVGSNYANSHPDRVVTIHNVTRKTAKANCVSTIQTYSETCVLSD